MIPPLKGFYPPTILIWQRLSSLSISCYLSAQGSDLYWQVLGDAWRYLLWKHRKRIYINNCCSKISTFGCSMMTHLSLCFFIKIKGWESINLGWDDALSCTLIPVFCPVACNATSLLPVPQVSLCSERKGVVLPTCFCLVSGLHWGKWHLVNLLTRTENSV